MTRAERNRLKWMVSGGGVLWMLLVGWLMWVTLPDGAVTTHSSDEMKERMALCSGNFRDRYDCKEQLIIESGREAFYILSLRFLLVIVPPMVGTFWLSSHLARNPVPVLGEEEHLHTTSNGDWKVRAQKHTEMQSPEEAAEELHLSPDELPSHPLRGHHRIDDIAPVDDWKARAQANVRGHKTDA
ncbi:MAG: hypothetical protein ACM3Q1_01460 [Bacteroidales bacterium]